MTAYRRFRRPGGTYFFTVTLAHHDSDLLCAKIEALRSAYRTTVAERPVRTDAIVILPNHLHAIWTLPDQDSDYSTRWRLIKTRFVQATGGSGPRSASKRTKDERGIWQRRFWEHTIRHAQDLDRHLRYTWLNPVHHGLVRDARDWPFSSIHRELRHNAKLPDLAGPMPEGCFGE